MAVDRHAPARLTPAAFRGRRVYAVGHSTRTQEELIALLWAHGVATLVDVRTFPRSRTNPQFNLEVLTEVMPAAGLGYVHLPALGGRRRGLGAESPNGAWRNASFRAYADHMQTPEFSGGLAQLLALCEAGPPAVMCAEGMRWRCHRSLLADAITARSGEVQHLESEARAVPHRPPPFARFERGSVRYPPEALTDGTPAPSAGRSRSRRAPPSRTRRR